MKKADGLEKGRANLVERLRKEGAGSSGQEQTGDRGEKTEMERLRVFVQINTSAEPQKAGVMPGSSEAVALVKHIGDACPHLQLQGVMTIGALGNSVPPADTDADAEEPNADFVALRRERDRICQEMGWEEERLELSMGMSADFEEAVRMGSDEVRVGTGIFGERPPKKGVVDGNQEGVEGKKGG